MESTQINVNFGRGDEGRRRLDALKNMALEQGFEWAGQGSIGRWLIAVADEQLERQQERNRNGNDRTS